MISGSSGVESEANSVSWGLFSMEGRRWWWKEEEKISAGITAFIAFKDLK
jgi:hypothetical protein